MPQKRHPKYEFFLKIEETEENKDQTDFRLQMRNCILYHNKQTNRVQVERFIMAEE